MSIDLKVEALLTAKRSGFDADQIEFSSRLEWIAGDDGEVKLRQAVVDVGSGKVTLYLDAMRARWCEVDLQKNALDVLDNCIKTLKEWNEEDHPRDEDGKFTFSGAGEEGGSGSIDLAPDFHSTAQDKIHSNPSMSAIKALTKNAEFKQTRFVITKDSDLLVGDAGKFTHQDVNPAYSSSAVVGLIRYNAGDYSYRAHGAYDNNPTDHPLLQRFEAAGIHRAGTGSIGIEFVSPNVASHLDFRQAVSAIDGDQQKSLREASAAIDDELGIASKDDNIVGAWADGAENSVMTFVPVSDWEHLTLSAAMKGYLADQKSVLVFQQGAGEAVLYNFKAKGDLADIHKNLLEDGIAFHTLVPIKDGAMVYVADLDGTAADAVEKGSGRYGSEVGVRYGQAEFIGTTKEDGTDREQRDSARASYEEIIDKSPVQGSREIWARLRDRWGQEKVTKVEGLPPTLREWNEEDHPRDEDGKFTFAGGGDAGSGEIDLAPDYNPHDAAASGGQPRSVTLPADPNVGKGDFEVVINPRSLRQVKDFTKDTTEQRVRVLRDPEATPLRPNGNLYIWDADKSLHEHVEGQLDVVNPGDENRDVWYLADGVLRSDNVIQYGIDQGKAKPEIAREAEARVQEWMQASIQTAPTPSANSVIQRAKAGIEEGSKSAKNPPLKNSNGHPGLISTASITAVKKTHGDSNVEYTRADIAQMRKDPELLAKNVDLFKNTKSYPLRASETKGNTEKVLGTVLDRMVANLRWLYETTPKEIRDRAALWYPGGRVIIDQQVKKYSEYGLTDVSAAAVYAALSPQKEWNENVYLGDRVIDIYLTKQNTAWDQQMTDGMKSMIATSKANAAKAAEKGVTQKGAVVAALKKIQGKKLSEITDKDPEVQAKLRGMWVRLYDEAHSDRTYSIISPEGERGETKLNKINGEKAKAGWSGLNQIKDAIQALDAKGDRDKISAVLTDRHKVRSFYNNLLDPFSKNDDATMDTHAVGAAWLMPFSGSSVAVAHSLGTSPKASAKSEDFVSSGGSAKVGIHGTYPIYGDAVRKLATELGISPRAVQSITWTAKRERFLNMTDKQYNSLLKVWKDYQANKLSLDEAHAQIDKITPMRTPDWMAK